MNHICSAKEKRLKTKVYDVCFEITNKSLHKLPLFTIRFIVEILIRYPLERAELQVTVQKNGIIVVQPLNVCIKIIFLGTT